ncbi:hypothetical protein KY314_01340 [Candidatus Woesearchaeota archaeon]|nr:hypothetical protein [Candidatus Woesearchaeota archaeon]
MKITSKDLLRWKENSLKLASKKGCDPKILNFIKQNTLFMLIESLPPKGNWYGWCIYDDKQPEIIVYHRNLSTEPIEMAIAALQADGMPDTEIGHIIEMHNKIGEEAFFEIYNQSGMDHEVIGHLYNHLNKAKHDERAAVYTQIDFAKDRSKSASAWKLILEIMPIVLAYHKDVDELKRK